MTVFGLGYTFITGTSTVLIKYNNSKVVGNEKVGGSRRWHMIDIGL